VNASTTTIRGVSIYSRQRKRNADTFDIALSSDGIVVQRTGRSDQRMAWERITEWEIEERPGCIVLTLRGEGSVTPLLVQGWTLEHLESVMREVTGTTMVLADGDGTAAAAAGPTATTDEDADATATAGADVAATAARAEQVEGPLPAEAGAEAGAEPGTEAEPRAEADGLVADGLVADGLVADRPPVQSFWKPLVTVVLLGVLATAVTLVLLQSAGVISWGFLGPVA
jgi:hypothetical protein